MNVKATDYLFKTVKVKIDRHLGSKHPKHGFVYEVNYGFIPDTTSGDGEELDAYVLGVNKPIQEFEGKCIAIIHRTNDDDDKLVVVTPEMENITAEEIKKMVNFQEQYFISQIIR
jgi:inorganic pyrophosphatase